MKETGFLKLQKPEEDDVIDIEHMNKNMERIDEQFRKQGEKIGTVGTATDQDIDSIIAGSYSGDTDPDPPDPSDVATDQDIDDIVNNLF